MIKGYARVSADGQTLEAQHHARQEAGAAQVFAEKMSGARRDRPALERCLGSLQPGDTVLVTKLDRLARSTRDLLNVLALIADYGASFRSLSDPWADTRTPHGRLMLTVLGGHRGVRAPSDPQPNQRRAGPSEGSRCSVRKLTKHRQTEAFARIAQGETLTAIARSYNVSHMTISRLASCGMAGQRQTRAFAVDVGVF